MHGVTKKWKKWRILKWELETEGCESVRGRESQSRLLFVRFIYLLLRLLLLDFSNQKLHFLFCFFLDDDDLEFGELENIVFVLMNSCFEPF